MATVDELLSKQKGRLEKMSVGDTAALILEPRKKIQRTGRLGGGKSTKISKPTHESEHYSIEESGKKGIKMRRVESKLSKSEDNVNYKVGQS